VNKILVIGQLALAPLPPYTPSRISC